MVFLVALRPTSPLPSVARLRALLNLLHLLNLLLGVLIGTSQTCRGYRENFSLPGRGAAPHSQSANLLIS